MVGVLVKLPKSGLKRDKLFAYILHFLCDLTSSFFAIILSSIFGEGWVVVDIQSQKAPLVCTK